MAFRSEIPAVTLPAGMRIGTAADAAISLKNNTQQEIPAGAATLRLVGDGLTTTATSVNLPRIAGGATVTVTVRVTPTAAASESIPVNFQLTLANVGGADTLTIAKGVVVPVVRPATLRVCIPNCGATLSLPLHVRAGTAFSIPTEMKTTAQGSFTFGKVSVSNPGLGNVNNTTWRVGPMDAGAGAVSHDNFQYTVSPELRGTTQWLLLDLTNNGVQIQTLKLPLQVD